MNGPRKNKLIPALAVASVVLLLSAGEVFAGSRDRHPRSGIRSHYGNTAIIASRSGQCFQRRSVNSGRHTLRRTLRRAYRQGWRDGYAAARRFTQYQRQRNFSRQTYGGQYRPSYGGVSLTIVIR